MKKEKEWGEETRVQVLDEQSPEKLEEELVDFKRMLSEHIEIHDENMNAAQEKLPEICDELRAQVDKLGEKVNSEFEKFTTEDNRLQTILSELCSYYNDDDSKMIQQVKTELLIEQTYDVTEGNPDEKDYDQNSRISSMYDLKTERKVASLELTCFEKRKPADLVPSFIKKDELSLSSTFFNEDEVEVLKGLTRFLK